MIRWLCVVTHRARGYSKCLTDCVSDHTISTLVTHRLINGLDKYILPSTTDFQLNFYRKL
jgi:hypothetical protein